MDNNIQRVWYNHRVLCTMYMPDENGLTLRYKVNMYLSKQKPKMDDTKQKFKTKWMTKIPLTNKQKTWAAKLWRVQLKVYQMAHSNYV